MNGLLFSTLLDEPLEHGKVVEILNGPLSGIRGVLIGITDGGRVTIQVDEWPGILLILSAENVALKTAENVDGEKRATMTAC
jgi:hypothetical protein